jgi:hypothetical protein
VAGPIVVGAVYSLFVIVLSLLKPNAGRIFLGFFFVAMGVGVNVAFLLTQPSFVADYGREAWLPLYRTLTETIIAPRPRIFGILLILFEVAMGLFLLSRGIWVKVGLIGTMIFVLALVPIHVTQIVWAVSVAANVYLLTKNFDTGFVKMIADRRRRKKIK